MSEIMRHTRVLILQLTFIRGYFSNWAIDGLKNWTQSFFDGGGFFVFNRPYPKSIAHAVTQKQKADETLNKCIVNNGFLSYFTM